MMKWVIKIALIIAAFILGQVLFTITCPNDYAVGYAVGLVCIAIIAIIDAIF